MMSGYRCLRLYLDVRMYICIYDGERVTEIVYWQKVGSYGSSERLWLFLGRRDRASVRN